MAEDCLIYGGAEGESGFSYVDFDTGVENALKKFKK